MNNIKKTNIIAAKFKLYINNKNNSNILIKLDDYDNKCYI